MGQGCSSSLDGVVHVATQAELRQCVASIETWTKAQETQRQGGMQTGSASGPLLSRVGGVEVVKRVVERFYNRMYANQRLLVFLKAYDIMYLRAKQSNFMSWLFGASTSPYPGRHLRAVHLRMIEKQGFSPEDFELGLSCFEDAMKDMGAPPAIMTEVMTKLRPHKDVIFTPDPVKDAEERARWAAQDAAAAAAATAAGAAAAGGAGAAAQRASSKLIQDGPVAGAAAGGGSGGSRPPSRCPFSGAVVSRPGTAAAAAAAAAAAGAVPNGTPMAVPSASLTRSAVAPAAEVPAAAAGPPKGSRAVSRSPSPTMLGGDGSAGALTQRQGTAEMLDAFLVAEDGTGAAVATGGGAGGGAGAGAGSLHLRQGTAELLDAELAAVVMGAGVEPAEGAARAGGMPVAAA